MNEAAQEAAQEAAKHIAGSWFHSLMAKVTYVFSAIGMTVGATSPQDWLIYASIAAIPCSFALNYYVQMKRLDILREALADGKSLSDAERL